MSVKHQFLAHYLTGRAMLWLCFSQRVQAVSDALKMILKVRRSDELVMSRLIFIFSCLVCTESQVGVLNGALSKKGVGKSK